MDAFYSHESTGHVAPDVVGVNAESNREDVEGLVKVANFHGLGAAEQKVLDGLPGAFKVGQGQLVGHLGCPGQVNLCFHVFSSPNGEVR